jgi:hypothetical protein
MLRVCAGLLALALALPAQASERASDLMAAMHLDDFIAIMVEEGVAYGAELDADFLGDEGGAYFAARVVEIYDGQRMVDRLRDALSDGMSATQIEESLTFFRSEAGRQAVELEVSARRAFMDPSVEDAARDAYAGLKNRRGPVFTAVERFVKVNALVDLNVRGALSSNYYFYRGMVSGGAYEMSEKQILAVVYEDAEDIRADTEEWMFSYLLVAYRPLSAEALDAYIAFSETAAGQALNAALFEGYDESFDAISFDLGEAVARAMQSSEL